MSELPSEAVNRLENWVQSHPSSDFLDPEMLSLENEDIAVSDLLRVLNCLVDQRQLIIRYKVKSPTDHTLADPIFEEPFVDEYIYDQSERQFNTLDGEFVPIFMEPE